MSHPVISVSPFDCRMWALHDRLESNVSEESCRDEIGSFERHGQLVPVLGRPLTGDLTHRYELIFGARRLFVAQHINKPLLMEVRELSDRDAIIAMDIENRQRLDVSPYERGMSYARWLRSGHFETQDDIARALKVSASQISRLLKFSLFPSVVLDAFSNPVDICECWGLDLFKALDDPLKRSALLQRARAIGSGGPRPAAREVYRQLMTASSRGPKLKAKTHDEVIKDSRGVPLFRIRQQSSSVAVLLPIERATPKLLADICLALVEILQTAEHEPVDAKQSRLSADPVAPLPIPPPPVQSGDLESMLVHFQEIGPKTSRRPAA